MKTSLECFPCLVRQALEGARHSTDDEALQEKILRRTCRAIFEMDIHESSPVIIGEVHRIIREVTGSVDPYKGAKDLCNQRSLELYPELEEIIKKSDNTFETAVRIAIAGNIMDFVVNPHVEQSDVKQAIDEALAAPLSEKTLKEFEVAVLSATEILYLGDNAGEIVFDKLFIEQLPTEKITFVVKKSPVVNDVTMEDAKIVNLTNIVKVIDSGSEVAGTPLNRCTEEFLEIFSRADLIISKGQGNYESLDDVDKQIFFLFKAKCVVIERALDVDVGAIMLINSRPRNPNS